MVLLVGELLERSAIMEAEMLVFKKGLYGLIGALVLSLGANFWNAYKMERFEHTLQEQMEGKFSESARQLIALSEQVNTVSSNMVSHAELEKRSREIVSGLSAETQENIRRYKEETGAQVQSIAVRFQSMEARLDKGIRRIGGKVDSQRTTTPPPAPEWKGVSYDDQRKCADYPERCAPFQFSWESPYQVSGKPLAKFSSPNLWAGRYVLDLNLAFKVVTIGYGEDQSELGAGAAQNQGLHIYAGYIDDKGEFVSIAEQEMLKGHPNLDGKMFYVPKVDVNPSRALRLFEPSLLVGSTYQDGGFGLSVGASLVNFAGGTYRVGASGILSEKEPYLSSFLSYHPMVMGKHLNIAPSLGWVLGTSGVSTWALGLQFQIW
jgi:hypothetical protein